MRSVFWEDGTDHHGMHSATGAGFIERADRNRNALAARYHILAPSSVELLSETEANVETYFHYVGVWKGEDDPDVIGALGGRYRDLFQKRNGEWRVLHRVVVYDWSTARSYDSGWDHFKIPLGIYRGTLAPDDATYASDWHEVPSI